jgi:hypothetical protein
MPKPIGAGHLISLFYRLPKIEKLEIARLAPDTALMMKQGFLTTNQSTSVVAMTTGTQSIRTREGSQLFVF